MIDEPKLCALRRTAGYIEECPKGWCPFWEHGGAVAEPHCALEHLGLELSDRTLARHLLELREGLERARSEEEAETARKQLRQIVPPDLSGA